MELENNKNNKNVNSYNNKGISKKEILVYVVLIVLFNLIFVTQIYLNRVDYNILGSIVTNKIEELKISVDSNYISSTKPQKIKINYYPSNSNLTDLRWKISSDETNTTLEIRDSLAYGKSKGKSRIWLENNYIKSNEIEFETVEFLNSINVLNPIKTMHINTEHKYDLKFLPDNSINKDIKIISSKSNVIEVKEDYTIKAKNKGTSKITIKDNFDNILYEEVIEVKWDRITNITFDETDVIIGKGQKYLVNTKIEPEYASYNDLVFISSNNNIVSVDEKGIITGNNLGDTVIEAKTNDNKVKKTYTVRVIEDQVSGGINYSTNNYDMYINSDSGIKVGNINIFEKFEIIKNLTVKNTNNNYLLVRNKDGIPGFINLLTDDTLLKTAPKLINLDYTKITSEMHYSEIASIYSLLKYYKVNTSLEGLYNNIKKGDEMLPNIENKGNNPEEVLALKYGSYESPILNLAKRYSSIFTSDNTLTEEKIDLLLDKNKPIIVWINKENLNIENGAKYIVDNKEVQTKQNWVAAVVKGYTKNYYIVNDPTTRENIVILKKNLLENYNKMGNRAIY